MLSPVVVDVVVLVDILVKTERSKLLYKYFIILHFFQKYLLLLLRKSLLTIHRNARRHTGNQTAEEPIRTRVVANCHIISINIKIIIYCSFSQK